MTSDSDLNSAHLKCSRRDDFRRARQALLEAWESHRMGPEQGGRPAGDERRTMAQVRDEQPPATAEYWLTDRLGIYPLKAGVNTIGRLPDNDVVIEGPHFSRRHCAILVHAGDICELYDLASRNGAYVNGLKVNGSTQLVSGDQICMCKRRFVFLSA
jgi:hypothetical protein